MGGPSMAHPTAHPHPGRGGPLPGAPGQGMVGMPPDLYGPMGGGGRGFSPFGGGGGGGFDDDEGGMPSNWNPRNANMTAQVSFCV